MTEIAVSPWSCNVCDGVFGAATIDKTARGVVRVRCSLRKVQQRTAVLIGRDDDDRVATSELLRKAYQARSRWAHGDELREQDSPDVAAVRDVVRRAFISWLAVTDGGVPPDILAGRCDTALLSQAAYAGLRAPTESLRVRVAGRGTPPPVLAS
jgi:hypothetical protein